MHAKKPAMARSHNAFQNIGEELIVSYSYSYMLDVNTVHRPAAADPPQRAAHLRRGGAQRTQPAAVGEARRPAPRYTQREIHRNLV